MAKEEKIDTDQIIKKAEITLKTLKHYQTQEIPRKEMSVKSIVDWCNLTIKLCKRIQTMERFVKDCQKTIQKLAPRNEKLEDIL